MKTRGHTAGRGATQSQCHQRPARGWPTVAENRSHQQRRPITKPSARPRSRSQLGVPWVYCRDPFIPPLLTLHYTSCSVSLSFFIFFFFAICLFLSITPVISNDALMLWNGYWCEVISHPPIPRLLLAADQAVQRLLNVICQEEEHRDQRAMLLLAWCCSTGSKTPPDLLHHHHHPHARGTEGFLLKFFSENHHFWLFVHYAHYVCLSVWQKMV